MDIPVNEGIGKPSDAALRDNVTVYDFQYAVT
jgi:hypothetical protein